MILIILGKNEMVRVDTLFMDCCLQHHKVGNNPLRIAIILVRPDPTVPRQPGDDKYGTVIIGVGFANKGYRQEILRHSIWNVVACYSLFNSAISRVLGLKGTVICRMRDMARFK